MYILIINDPLGDGFYRPDNFPILSGSSITRSNAVFSIINGEYEAIQECRHPANGSSVYVLEKGRVNMKYEVYGKTFKLLIRIKEGG